MKTFLLPFLVLSFGLIPALPAHATEQGHFAESIVGSNYQIQTETNLLGAPDELYADIRTNGAYVKIDLGESAQFTDDLTLFYLAQSIQAQLQFDFYDTNNSFLYTYGNIVPLETTWTISYPLSTPYRYVGISSKSAGTLRIDAIQVGSTPEESVLPQAPEEVIDRNPLHGSLIRPTGTDAIYLLDKNNVRHLIPNETVFRSWNLSFDDVTVVGSGTLTGMPLGKNVYLRPGTFLVKTAQSPKVYVVDQSGTLHWIETEALARELYGEGWQARVIDLPETLFVQYSKGDSIKTTHYVDGSFVKTEGGSAWYIGNKGKRYSIGPLTTEALHLNEAFLGTNLTESRLAELHPYESQLVYQDAYRWPF